MRNGRPFDTFIYNVRSNIILLFKQLLPSLSRFGDLLFPFSAGPRFPKGEEVAEVGLFPVRDILALGLVALIVGMGVVEDAV